MNEKQTKNVVVTGAGRGIGRAVTEKLAALGWTVYATARSDTHLHELERMDNVHPLALDITDRQAVSGMSTALPDEIHGLVNNAGIAVHGPVETLSHDALYRQFDVNVFGQIAVTQTLLPQIRQSGGRIVFVSSLSGLTTTPGLGAYCASKYAIESFADALRIELRPWNIPVSLIEPGTTRTDFWGEILTEFDAMHADLAPEHRNLYHQHLTGMKALLTRMQKMGVSPSVVANSVEHALTSGRPRTRYMCDNTSRIRHLATHLMPTALNDAVLSKLTTD